MQIPNGFIAIVDTREKLPYELKIKETALPFQVGTLKVADYSILGFEDHVGIERKSLLDLLGCIGKHRARFERELVQLERKLYRALVVESSWAEVEQGHFRSHLHPNAIVGSLLSWVSRGIPVLMLDNRERASEYTSRLLLHAYKRLTGGAHVEVSDAVPDVPVSNGDWF